MKKIICALILVTLFCSVANAEFLVPDPADQCVGLFDDGCMFVERIVSRSGFFTSVGEGRHFNTDDTGNTGVDILAAQSRLYVNGSPIFRKSSQEAHCSSSGELWIDFDGDYYEMNETCGVSSIVSRNYDNETAKIIRIRFNQPVTLINNPGILQLLDSQNYTSNHPFIGTFLMDRGIYFELPRAVY